MKINFVLSAPWISGGTIAVLEYANRFTEMGHETTVIWPRWPWERRKGLRGVKDSLCQLWCFVLGSGPGQIDYMKTQARLLVVPAVHAWYVPNADVSIATAWRTAEWVNHLPASKGHKFYFIQHYETWDGPKDRVDRTWTMPLTKLVVSSWLKDIAERQFSEEALGPLIYGVDTKQFYNDHKVFGTARRVGMLYSTRDWKGVADGLRAMDIVRSRYPHMELVMFGAYPPGKDVPSYARYHFQPPRSELYQIYSTCDIWMCASWVEGGPPMPSQEAAACKCAIVTTDVGAARDVFVPGESALFSSPRDVEALATNVIWLIEHPEEMQRIALAGYERVRQFTWEKAAIQFLSYLEQQESWTA